MHAIRVMMMLLTAWMVAEYYAKPVMPSEQDYEEMDQQAEANIEKLRNLLTAEDVPPLTKGRQTLEPAIPTLPTYNAELNEWLETMLRHSKRAPPNGHDDDDDEENTSKPFAWTPKNSQYYYLEENQFRPDPTQDYQEIDDVMEHMKRLGLAPKIGPAAESTNALVADEVDDLVYGFDNTDRPRHTFLYETNASNFSDSIYSIAILIGVIAAITVSLIGLTYGLYVLSKKIRSPDEPDYPAYGVTGPSDPNGDRRLAHSAHLYHYQHQKQQIIAMEKGGVPENRPGSVSEPESDEENQEGDYTVYECPGFATTGDMEVKNPMFSDDPTPATPAKVTTISTPATAGKCEIVRPQPKE